VIYKSGIVELFERKEDDQSKPKESFHIQGGEECTVRPPHLQRFRLKIIIPEHKTKDSKWVFGFSSEQIRDEWHEIFKGIFARIDAMSKVSQVMSSANSESMESQLQIAVALADCGQLGKARRIFSKLLQTYGSTENVVHEKYEEFLSRHCHDVHNAEQNFLKRQRFFCVPKEFLTTSRGTEFKRISQRVEFLTAMRTKLIDAMQHRKAAMSSNDDSKASEEPDVEYMNLENLWPTRLYAVSSKHRKAARKAVKSYLESSHQSEHRFEYSYHDIEQRAFYLIKHCIDGQRGTTRLQARLDLVTDSEIQKEYESANNAIHFERRIESLTMVSMNKSSSDASTHSTGSAVKLSPMIRPKVPPKMPHNLTDEILQHVKPRLDTEDCLEWATKSIERLRSMESMVELDDDELMEIMGDLDMAAEFGAKSVMPQMKGQMTVSVVREEESDSEPEDNEKYFQMMRNKSALQRIRKKKEEEEFWKKPEEASSGTILANDVADILDKHVTTVQPSNFEFSPSPLSSDVASVLNGQHGLEDHDMQIMLTIQRVLEAPAHPIYPWTAFLLIWKTRRDHMGHIGDSNAHQSQIQVILEFVYLFTRCIFLDFEHRPQYALLLQTLFRMASDADFEDVKYKMTLSGVRVLGDSKVVFSNKIRVGKFMQTHRWLMAVDGENQVSAMRRYFLRGFREEIQRIHDSLNAYYESNAVYKHKSFVALMDISSPDPKKEMTSQTVEKVQGEPTWGPRVRGNGDKTGYDPVKFKASCAHRDIVVPKPTVDPDDFEECYLLFCLTLAEKLDPYFQAQVQTAFRKSKLRFSHHPTPIKDKQRCYELLKKELRTEHPPKAAKILDYCSCTVGFKSVPELIEGYKTLEKLFVICRVRNFWDNHSKPLNVNNYKYMIVYIVCRHPTIKFVRLICEIRMTLEAVYELNDERAKAKELFGMMLAKEEMWGIMKEVVSGHVPEDTAMSPKPIKAKFRKIVGK